MSRTLRDVAIYSKERVLLSDLDTTTYVSTNNLLQNKEGKVNADSLPPNGKTVKKFTKGDILIANIRPYLKKIWLATHGGGNSTDVLALKVHEDFNSSFVYYSLFRDIFFEHMMNGSKGTKMPRGDKNQTLDFPIPEFDRPKQDKVSKVLSDLDAKIELNKKINEELEAMAKLIYDYWFVQFDFPDGEGNPYKSSGGKMVFNEELNREIPEGWEVGGFEDLGDIVSGSTPSKSEKENFTENGIPWITPKDLSDNSEKKFFSKGELDVTEKGVKDASLKIIPVGTVLLSSRAPIGYLAIARNPVTTNQGFKSIVPNEYYSSEYIYYTIITFIDAMIQYASGSTFKEISATILKMIKIHLPPKSLVKQFTQKIKPIFEKQDILEKENKELEDLRNWLLPMLMNGQVTVAEAEQELSKAAESEVEYELAKKPTNVDYYKRMVLAAEIVWQLHKQSTLGHVKLQKLIYLSQETSRMRLPTNFLQQAAGPYDPRMARSLDKQLKKKKWFAFKKGELFKYKPLENAGEHQEDFEKLFSEEKENIRFLINTFGKQKTEKVEIVATLYACWKEILENDELATEELLIQKFYDWSEEKAKFGQERLMKAINWMKEQGIVPV